MSFDRVKINKVESIIAALSLQEQAHIGQYVARILGTAPPQRTVVPPVPTHTPPPASPPGAPLTRMNMHQALRHGEVVEFVHPTQGRIKATVKSINTKSVSVVPVIPIPGERARWWRVSPGLIHQVGTTVTPQQVAAQKPAWPIPTGAPTASSVPTAEGAGSW